MEALNSWLYNDKFDNFWRFILKDNGELIYNIMYGEDKWSKESKIDNGVLDFVLNIDEEDNIHLVYSTRKGELKYCLWESGQWFGKTIYSYDSITYDIKEISLYKVGKNMHVFFMLNNRKNIKKASLTHYTWNDQNSKMQNISNINIIAGTDRHYDVEIGKENKVYLFFINYEKNESVLRSCEYEKNTWSNKKRLYSIDGSNINFSTLMNKDKIHIMNMSKEDSKYILEHVILGKGYSVENYKIYESNKEIRNPIFITTDGILYSIWMEEDKILYSCLNEKWSIPIEINRDEEDVILYHTIFNKTKDTGLQCKRMFCVTSPKIKVFLPVNNEKVGAEHNIPVSGEMLLDKEDIKENLHELVKTKYINKNLEKKVITLQMQLKQKERFMNDIEENLNRVIEQKRKTEEKYKIFVDVHQTVQKEMQEAKEKLNKESDNVNLLKRKLDEMINENEKFKNQCEVIFKENEKLKRNLNEVIHQNEVIKDNYEQLNNERTEILQQNEVIKNNFEQLNNEKIEILNELEQVKNKSFVYKFLKK